jgi:hypothetical protein
MRNDRSARRKTIKLIKIENKAYKSSEDPLEKGPVETGPAREEGWDAADSFKSWINTFITLSIFLRAYKFTKISLSVT